MAVYVIQDQNWVDPRSGRLKPKFDFTPAKRFGELEYLLPSGASPFNLPPSVRILHEKLRDFGNDDYLLLTGNPVLIGIASAIAADYNDGKVAMLQWSGAKKDYIPVYASDVFDSAMRDTDCVQD